MTSPTGGHASAAQGALFLALSEWQTRTGDGGLLLEDIYVELGDDNVLAPDIAWWSAERQPPLVAGALAAVPDLVVEVLSPGTRENDLGPKRDAYGRAGVSELWLVDPAVKRITVCAGDGLRSERPVESGFESALLVDLTLDRALIFKF